MKNDSISYNSLATLLLVVVLCLPNWIMAQHGSYHDEEPNGVQKLIEHFTVYPNKKRADADTTVYPAKIILAPIVSFTPETSLAFGVGAKYLFKLRGSGSETRTSNMPISVEYSLKNQFILSSGFEIFSPGEKYMLEGNVRFQNFPRLYFGVGRNTPDDNESIYSSAQFLVEPLLLKRVLFRYLFVGAGPRYNGISGVKLEAEKIEGFERKQPGVRGSKTFGGELALIYDSRNNLLNATKGVYVKLTHGFYDTKYGSSHRMGLTRLDLRYFINFTPEKYNILAFQVKTHIARGSVPLAEMAFFGGKEMMRGFYEGRYIDAKMIAFQTEYRTEFTDWLGVTAFAGIGDVAEEFANFQAENLRWAVGLGLRLKLDRRENLNMRFDWGFTERSNNYYFKISEAF